jgi:hypothetical protein
VTDLHCVTIALTNVASVVTSGGSGSVTLADKGITNANLTRALPAP